MTKNQMLQTQQPHGQEQAQQRKTTQNNMKQRKTTIHHDSYNTL